MFLPLTALTVVTIHIKHTPPFIALFVELTIGMNHAQ